MVSIDQMQRAQLGRTRWNILRGSATGRKADNQGHKPRVHQAPSSSRIRMVSHIRLLNDHWHLVLLISEGCDVWSKPMPLALSFDVWRFGRNSIHRSLTFVNRQESIIERQ